jgi:hypothetical protein
MKLFFRGKDFASFQPSPVFAINDFTLIYTNKCPETLADLPLKTNKTFAK